MTRRISNTSLILQTPIGFHTSSGGAVTLPDGTLLKPDSQGLYHLDEAHAHLLAGFVAQGWHAPRPEMGAPKHADELEREVPVHMPNTGVILDFAAGEHVELKVEDGRLHRHGEPSARLRAHLHAARIAVRDELVRRAGKHWVEV